jgi:hypothetical protein
VNNPDPVVSRSLGRHDSDTAARKPRARYRFGFFARYLRQFVLAKMDAEGWKQFEVADWLDIPQHALSEYLNRHTHPSPERRTNLVRLGCQEAEMDRAEFTDKLEWWMSTHGLASAEVVASLESIQAYERELRFARVTAPGSGQGRPRTGGLRAGGERTGRNDLGGVGSRSR